MLVWAIWNLFLACLPIPLGVHLAQRIQRAAPERRLPGPRTALVAAAWLLLLPNAPYLVADVRHFVFDAPWRRLTGEAASDAGAWRASVVLGFGFVFYGVLGLLAMAAAVRPVQQALRTRWPRLRRLRLPFFGVVALGVWLGLVPRFNSWDALLRPLEVLRGVGGALSEPVTVLAIVAYGIFLAVMHDVICAAWDGWRLHRRLERRLQPDPE